VDIWVADLKPGRLTAESFDSVLTLQEHSSWLIAKLSREIETDPDLIYAYDQRADCALWTGHGRANEYLQEFDRALTRYDAPACANRAKQILNWPLQQRDRLVPLALLLTRKALAKDPNNPDYAELLHVALKVTTGNLDP